MIHGNNYTFSAHWIEKARKWRVYQVNVAYFHMDKGITHVQFKCKNSETVNFLLQIADQIEKLTCIFMQPIVPVSYICELLNRKICQLNIVPGSLSNLIWYSLKEVESIIKASRITNLFNDIRWWCYFYQIFNASSKKLRLVIQTELVPSENHIGLFKIR